MNIGQEKKSRVEKRREEKELSCGGQERTEEIVYKYSMKQYKPDRNYGFWLVLHG